MKKAASIALSLLATGLAFIAVYRFCIRKSIPDAPASEQVLSILEKNDCFVCHSKSPQLPFYSKLPVLGSKMAEHSRHAARFTELEGKVGENIDEVTLSMIDYAAKYGKMPIIEYRLIHWGTGFNKKERRVIAGWVKEKRGTDEPVCVIPESVEYDSAKAGLGEKLFNDNRLSLDGTINCATCHVLENGGADHADERVSEGIDGLKGGVNAPTVYNSDFNIRQFWNGRAADLREQAEGPATNPVEMGDQTLEQICQRLGKDKALVREFEELYPEEGLTPMTMTSAIAEFEKSLITPNCRFDKYLKGGRNAITDAELEGYELFKKNACATCHTGVILGGRSFEYVDVYGDYFADRTAEIEYNPDDDGLKGFTGNEDDLHKFKVPGLRNVTMTAPYFHDGSFTSLEGAISAMARYELGKDLSGHDVQSIIAFLNTLTGENPHLSNQPASH